MNRSTRVGLAALAVLAAAAGCAGSYRFRDEAVVWRFDDERDIPEPEEVDFRQIPYFGDIIVFRRLTRAMELGDDNPAQNTNALDEVPSSTWFTNRVGVRRITPAEVATGASADGPAKPPLFAFKGKTHGNNPGIWVRDVRGRKYLLKFDKPGHLGLQTSSGVIVNRFLWALGYNVPNDAVLHLRRDELRVGAGAKIEDEYGDERRMLQADLDKLLAGVARTPDGGLRAMSSELLEGKPKGGFAPEGVREDDPNDLIPHEHRRELRALRVFCAWLNYTDTKSDNTLDMYVEEDGRRFLKHYLLDFGESLGAHWAEWGRPEHGYEHIWDWSEQGKALVSLGLYERAWESLEPTPWPSIGLFSAKEFDPRRWRETYPFWPFFELTPADAFWAAKLVMRFDRAMIEAVVAEAQLPEPEAANYLVNVLVERAFRVGLAYIEAVTPLDHFRLHPDQLCATDLGMYYRLARSGAVERVDDDGEVTARYRVGERGRVCIPLDEGNGYSIYRLRTVRGDATRPPLEIHVKGGRSPRILGIARGE
jgi:hypothetical protein